jgi:hypothetical protein
MFTAIRFRVMILAGIAVALAGCSSSTAASSTNPASAPAGTPSATASPAEPETAAGARAAAQRFYDLYSASQFAAAWSLLNPQDQLLIPQTTYVAVDTGCPSAAAGLARVIKRVTITGNTAVVVETVAGALSSLGTVTDVFVYVNGRWGFSYPANVLAVYRHKTIAADIAAARARGFCSG